MEFPHLEELYQEYKARGVVFLAINIEDSPEVIKKYFEENKFTFKPVCQKTDEISQAYKVTAYPTNYVVGPDGKIVAATVGSDPHTIKDALEKVAPKK